MDDKSELAKKMLGETLPSKDSRGNWSAHMAGPGKTGMYKDYVYGGEKLKKMKSEFYVNKDLAKKIEGIEPHPSQHAFIKREHRDEFFGGRSSGESRLRRLFSQAFGGPAKTIYDALEKWGPKGTALNALDLIPKEIVDGVSKDGAFGYMNKRKHGS